MKTKGFTLIELLVVIAIIGMLSAVILASLNTARAKARDAQRSASIRQVQNALELYYNDNGNYPSSTDLRFAVSPLVGTLTPTYISALPVDPQPATAQNGYHYYNNAQNPATWYAIYIGYETKSPCWVAGGSYTVANYWSVSQC